MTSGVIEYDSRNSPAEIRNLMAIFAFE